MRAIVVDDEPLMLQAFARMSAPIDDLEVVGSFTDPVQAIDFARKNRVQAAFLDVRMPQMTGDELATALRRDNPDLLVVLISAYDTHARDCNRIGGDYFISKPYRQETLSMVMDKLRLLALRQRKPLYAQMLGRFVLLRDGEAVPLTGRAKKILAYVAARRGKEVSNEEIYCALWEGRKYSNVNMKVYYNALKRLRDALEREGLADLLISTANGQMINTSLLDSDYYDWQDAGRDPRVILREGLLCEYPWSEYLIGEIVNGLRTY
ncbi:MAG: response regulator [Coriobacteriia bacterium]|nr:response regulator [Coriobacteriia bacterium]